jgi:hypothetical protein
MGDPTACKRNCKGWLEMKSHNATAYRTNLAGILANMLDINATERVKRHSNHTQSEKI